MQTLIKTLSAENGQVFAVKDGRRTCVAKSQVTVEIYEHSTKVASVGAKNYGVKIRYDAEIISEDGEMMQDVDTKFLQQVSRFEVLCDVARADGIFERLHFDAISPNEIDLFASRMVFEVSDSNIVKKLLKF